MIYKGTSQKPYHLLVFAFIIVSFLLSMILRYEKVIEEDIFKIATNDVLHISRNYGLYIKDALKDSSDYTGDIKTDKKPFNRQY